MKFIEQTKFGNEAGNCLEACLATLLNVDISKIPTAGKKNNWFDVLNKQLIASFGIYMCAIESKYKFKPIGYHMIWGPSPRFKDVDHSVIGYNGISVFDPNPDKTGLKVIREYVLLVQHSGKT